jgi:hypothetical protein
MRLKRPDETKSERIDFRISKKIKNQIKAKANLYTEGNVTEYMLYASLNFVPGKEDFEPENKSAPRKVRR